jgi:hypothetical protein
VSEFVLFYMWDPVRHSLIEGHKFYVDQARSRLLSQFDNIDNEAKKAGADFLDRAGQNFDPDRHDPDSFYEAAHDESISFFQLLEGMRDNTRLSVVAGMYHEWDKQLRDWIVREINHWHGGDEVRAKIWSQDFGGLADFFAALDWDIRDKPYYAAIDACRLVINVYKHGEGSSFSDLKRRYPEYIRNIFKDFEDMPSSMNFLDYTCLKVSEEQIDRFSEGIVAFWNDVPERIFNVHNGELPTWFKKAWLKDNK